MGKRSDTEEYTRQKRELQMNTGKTARTQLRYLMMLGRGEYMEKVRQGTVVFNPEILERFKLDGDAK